MKYQSKSHAIESAKVAGSSAKTFAGAARYLVAQARNSTQLHKRGKRSLVGNRGAAALRDLPRLRLAQKADARALQLGVWRRDDAMEQLASVDAQVRVSVPLGTKTADQLREKAHAANTRLKNWDRPEETTRPKCDQVETIDHGRYSSRCTFKHLTYRPTVTSCAVISAGGKLRYEYANESPAWLAPPRGYHWDRDQNGVRLVSLSDSRKDYHPDSDDLRSYDARSLARKITALFKQRREQARINAENLRLEKLSASEQTRLIAKAEREGCVVCLRDSIKAGNCRAGSVAFAQRHNLDPAKHYRPSKLLRIANGDAQRVKLVVAVALRRHRHEMAAGYCLLEDHQ
ncbi:MAG: hypothetical protein RBR03_09025 [Desulfuromonas thiophila]|jgi:hypothetical protein|nr:hypothetical protein [Desulfuromonas thiophila]MDY0398787.1 hypothetical protein [Desulfuromonas thiophila]